MAKSICSGLALSFIFVALSTAQADESEVPQVRSERSARNAIYIELGGNGEWNSLNYERFVMDAGAIRIGGMFRSLVSSAAAGRNAPPSASSRVRLAPMLSSHRLNT